MLSVWENLGFRIVRRLLWSSRDVIRIVGARLSRGVGFPNWAFGA